MISVKEQMYKTAIKWIYMFLVLTVSATVNANDELLRLTGDARYWSMPSGNYSNWRYSNLSQINNKNAGKLKLAWSFATGSLGNHTGGPIILPASITGLGADTLFLHTPYPNEILAINLESRQLEWIYKAATNNAESCCQSANYGISYANGRIFLQQDDLKLVALDIRTGRVLWQQSTGYGLQGYANMNVPQPIGNYVFTNIFDVNGVSVSTAAFQVSNGRPAWSAGSVGADKDILFNQNTTHLGVKVGVNSSANSWLEHFPEANYHSWVALAWDSRENIFYYGSAADKNNDSTTPPGEKKWTSTIFARDLNTGIARWVYQMTPDNEWGFNGSNEILLVDLEINDNRVPALVHFDQNGFVYVLNRTTGELLSAEKYDPTVNWATHINLSTGKPVRNINTSRYLSDNDSNITVCPSPDGLKSVTPASYSPRTGYFYVPTNNTCIVHEKQERTYSFDVETGFELHDEPETVSTIIAAGSVGRNNEEYLGKVIAWDAAREHNVWTVNEKWPVRSGVLTTAGDILVYGTLDGYVKMLDAKTGRLLWRFRVPSGVAGNITSWMYRDKQYIGVVTGVDPDRLDQLGLTASEIYQDLAKFIRAGGSLMVFSLP